MVDVLKKAYLSVKTMGIKETLVNISPLMALVGGLLALPFFINYLILSMQWGGCTPIDMDIVLLNTPEWVAALFLIGSPLILIGQVLWLYDMLRGRDEHENG